jgi:ATP-dependent DNA ligase
MDKRNPEMPGFIKPQLATLKARAPSVIDQPVLLARGKVSLQFGKVGPALVDDHHFAVDDCLTGHIQRKQLDTVVSPKSKLTKQVRKPKATWVEPTFFADVEFRDITSEGLLRQSSFKGLTKK